MNVSLTFDPQKSTYGFLFGVAKFTKSSKTLEEVLNTVNQYDLSDNLENYCEGFSDNSETNNGWATDIKAMIVLNKHSSCSVHKTLSEDENRYVRWNTAEFTHYTSLITNLCKNSKEQIVFIGLLDNPHLNSRQYNMIVKRLIDGTLYIENKANGDIPFDGFIKYRVLQHPFLSESQRKKLQALVDNFHDEEDKRKKET